jgi:hypothetical protein
MPDMPEYQESYDSSYLTEFGTKIRDLEERQRVAKSRLLLIGKNMIDMKETFNEELIGMKKDIEIMKQDIKRMKDFIKNISYEMDNFAKKTELNILSKQAKMFQPMELVTKEEVKEMIESLIKGHKNI